MVLNIYVRAAHDICVFFAYMLAARQGMGSSNGGIESLRGRGVKTRIAQACWTRAGHHGNGEYGASKKKKNYAGTCAPLLE